MSRWSFDMISLEPLAPSYSFNSLYVHGSPGCICVRHAATYSGSCCHGIPVDDMMRIGYFRCSDGMNDSWCSSYGDRSYLSLRYHK